MDHHPLTDYERKVDEHAMKMLTRSMLITAFSMWSLSFVITGSIYAYVVHGTYSIPSGSIIPFVDPNTGQGYAINIAVQSVMTLSGVVALVIQEIVSCVINNTFGVMSDMIAFNCRKFSNGLRQGTFTNENGLELRHIFLQLLDMEQFIGEINDLLYWRYFLQPVLTTGCVALGIFSQLNVSKGIEFFFSPCLVPG